MSDASLIREVWPRHTMKRLALALGVPLNTARHWLYREISPARRQQVAEALLAEMDRQEVSRAALRRRLADWAARK